jgi:ribonuclease D
MEAIDHRSRMAQVPVVTSAEGLDAVCDHVRATGRFGFDTEFIKEETFEPVVCLMQVATDAQTVLVDPLTDRLDVTPLWSLVADEGIEVIVHAGGEDLGLCYRALGRPPARVFDVQIAAGLVGMDYPLSLTRLVRAALGVRLPKSQTLTDWRRRPLSETQKRYAAEDVAYLPAIHRVVNERLSRLGRRPWAAEEFAKLESAEAYAFQRDATLGRIKGIGSLDGRRLAIARELVAERDALAKQLNRPARAVLRDHLLVEIARHGWTDTRQIRSLRGIQLNNRSLRRLVEAVRRAPALSADPLPAGTPPPGETPEEAVLIALATAVIRAHCLKSDLAFPLVTTKRQIRAWVVEHVRGQASDSPPSLSRGWRGEVFAPLLEQVLSGAASIRLTEGPTCPKLEVSGLESGSPPERQRDRGAT